MAFGCSVVLSDMGPRWVHRNPPGVHSGGLGQGLLGVPTMELIGGRDMLGILVGFCFRSKFGFCIKVIPFELFKVS